MTHRVEQRFGHLHSCQMVSSTFGAVDGDEVRFLAWVHPQRNLVRQALTWTWGHATENMESSSRPAIMKPTRMRWVLSPRPDTEVELVALRPVAPRAAAQRIPRTSSISRRTGRPLDAGGVAAARQLLPLVVVGILALRGFVPRPAARSHDNCRLFSFALAFPEIARAPALPQK